MKPALTNAGFFTSMRWLAFKELVNHIRHIKDKTYEQFK